MSVNKLFSISLKGFTLIILSAILMGAFTSCNEKKSRKSRKKVDTLESKIDSINKQLPLELNNEITWVEATLKHDQVRYIYNVSSAYLSKIDNASTRASHKSSLLEGGGSYKLGQKLADEGYGIAFIYKDAANSENRMTIEFTPEEVKALYSDGDKDDSNEDRD